MYDGGNEGNASILTAIKESGIENESSVESNYWARLARALNTKVAESSFKARTVKGTRIPLIETNANDATAFYCPSTVMRGDKMTEKDMCELSLKYANCTQPVKSKTIGPIRNGHGLEFPITGDASEAPSPTSDIITFVPFTHRKQKKTMFAEPPETSSPKPLATSPLSCDKDHSKSPGKKTIKGSPSSLPGYMLPTIATTRKSNTDKCVRTRMTSSDAAKPKPANRSTLRRSKTVKQPRNNNPSSPYDPVAQLKQLCSSPLTS